MAGHDTCIVFLTHFWDEVLARRFDRLRAESAPHADCFLLLQGDDESVVGSWKAHLRATGAGDSLFTFNSSTLPVDLGIRYFGSQRVMTNTHFPLLFFSHAFPTYSYYWQVEGDVEYRGRWGDFFAAYAATDASLLAAHFHRWHDWPNWFWWPSVTAPPGEDPKVEEMYKAFLAVSRFSKDALRQLEQAHRQGWMGHFEVMIPSVLLRAGLRLEDLNVKKPCYIGSFQNPVDLLPLLSTLRYRPSIGMNEFSTRGEGALLFHPVKERWTFDGEKVVVAGA